MIQCRCGACACNTLVHKKMRDKKGASRYKLLCNERILLLLLLLLMLLLLLLLWCHCFCCLIMLRSET